MYNFTRTHTHCKPFKKKGRTCLFRFVVTKVFFVYFFVLSSTVFPYISINSQRSPEIYVDIVSDAWIFRPIPRDSPGSLLIFGDPRDTISRDPGDVWWNLSESPDLGRRIRRMMDLQFSLEMSTRIPRDLSESMMKEVILRKALTKKTTKQR